jgi:hypothetical protein
MDTTDISFEGFCTMRELPPIMQAAFRRYVVGLGCDLGLPEWQWNSLLDSFDAEDERQTQTAARYGGAW